MTANDFQEEFLRKMRTIQNKSIDTKPRTQRRNAAQSTKSSECFKKGLTTTPKPNSPKKESTTKQGSGKYTAEEIKKKEKKHDELKDKKEKEVHNEKGVKEKAEQNTTGKELNINDKKKEMSSGSLKKEQPLEKKNKTSKESASEQDKRKLSGHEAGTRNEKASSEKKDVKAKDTKSDEKKKEKNVDTEKAQKEKEAREPKEKKIADGEKISKKEPLPEKMQKSSSFSNKKTSKQNESSEQKKKRKEDEDDGKQKKEKDQSEKKEKRERDDSNKKDSKGKGDSEKSEKKEKDDSNKKDRKEKNESEKRDKNETDEKKEKTNLTERKRKSVPSKSKTMPSSAAKEEKRKGEDIPEGQESKAHTEHKEKKEKKKGETDAKKGKGSPHKSSTMRPASKSTCQVQTESDKKEKGKVKEVIDERKESEPNEPAKTEKKNNTEGQKESLKREDSASGIATEQTTFSYTDNTEVPINEETDVVNGAESDDDINISAESMDDVSEEDIQDAETAPPPEKLETREASAPRLCAPASTAACTATIKSGVPRMGGRRPLHGRFTTMMPTPQVQLELAARTPVSADKVVVIDNGSSFIKVGFTGEDAPRSVVPAFVARNEATGKYVCGSAAIHMPHAVNPIDPRKPIDWERATVLWKYVLYKELKVDPCDHCVVLSELPTMDVPSQRRMEGVFFDQLCVPGAKVVNSAVTSLFAGGMTTGLVVEIGNRMQVVPVIDTCPINSAVYTQRVGVGDLTERFSRLLLESGIRASTREDMEEVRKLKERCCYVAADYEAEERRPADEIRTTVTFRGREYAISRERYECPEAIFNPFVAGVDAPGLVEIIARTVDKCPIDYRKELLTHILLSGGSTLFPGFEARLKRDLEKLLADRGHVKCSVNIIAMKNRKYLAWTGMAIMASLQTFLKNDIVWVEDYHYAQNAGGQTESGEDDNEDENENEFANETEIEHEHEKLF